VAVLRSTPANAGVGPARNSRTDTASVLIGADYLKGSWSRA
jgi:hypothetical protein